MSIMFRSVTLPFIRMAILSLVIGLSSTVVYAQDNFVHHDNFDDGDVTDATQGGVWQQVNLPPGTTMDASSGDLVFNTENGFTDAALVSFNGDSVRVRGEWSFRARMTVYDGTFAAVGTTAFSHAGLIPAIDGEIGRLRVGTRDNNSSVPLGYSYFDQEVMIQLDAFDGMLTGHVWKPDDFVESYRSHSRPYLIERSQPNFGVNGTNDQPGHVSYHEAWVSTTPLPVPSMAGDTNLDGTVDFSDFVTLSNNYGGPGTWVEGDFDGDGKVLFTDFILLSGNFGNDVSAVVQVPEPGGWLLSLVMIAIVALNLARLRPGARTAITLP